MTSTARSMLRLWHQVILFTTILLNVSANAQDNVIPVSDVVLQKRVVNVLSRLKRHIIDDHWLDNPTAPDVIQLLSAHLEGTSRYRLEIVKSLPDAVGRVSDEPSPALQLNQS